MNEIEKEITALRAIQKELSVIGNNRSQYLTQLHENEIVQKELGILEDGAGVYKLVGPVLVQQDLQEARSNVAKRVEYISKELERLTRQYKELNEKAEVKKARLQALQEATQQQAQKAIATQ